MGGLLPKPETAKEVEDSHDAVLPFGVSAMQGWRKAMEDSHLALPAFEPERNLSLFGVFDGHGGAAVAKVAAARLPDTLRALPAFQEGRFEDALYEAFLKLDAFLDSADGRKEVAALVEDGPESSDGEDADEEEVIRELIARGELDEADLKRMQGDGDESDEDLPGAEGGEESEEEGMEDSEEEEEEEEPGDANNAWADGEGPDGMGCTAVVALVRGGAEPHVWCANAGDSRCVLARGQKALNMSRDHKPALKCERERIKKAGGFVTDEGRVDGNLNLSRSLGDFAYKKDRALKPIEQKISAEAEIRNRALTDSDRFLLLGCDGIFEKATSQALVDFMIPRLHGLGGGAAAPSRRSKSAARLSGVCSAFLDHNIAKVPTKENGLGCDNMTLMAVDLAGALPSAAPSGKGSAAVAAGKDKCNGSARSLLATAKCNGSLGVRRTVQKSRAPGPLSPRRRLLLAATAAAKRRRQQQP